MERRKGGSSCRQKRATTSARSSTGAVPEQRRSNEAEQEATTSARSSAGAALEQRRSSEVETDKGPTMEQRWSNDGATRALLEQSYSHLRMTCACFVSKSSGGRSNDGATKGGSSCRQKRATTSARDSTGAVPEQRRSNEAEQEATTSARSSGAALEQRRSNEVETDKGPTMEHRWSNDGATRALLEQSYSHLRMTCACFVSKSSGGRSNDGATKGGQQL